MGVDGVVVEGGGGVVVGGGRGTGGGGGTRNAKCPGVKQSNTDADEMG